MKDPEYRENVYVASSIWNSLQNKEKKCGLENCTVSVVLYI